MNSIDLISAIMNKSGMSEEKIQSFLDAFKQIITEELQAGHEVDVPGFGELTITSHRIDSAQSGPISNNTAEDEANKLHIEIGASAYIPYIDLSKTMVPKKILANIPEHVARHYQTVPVAEENGKLTVAMIDPEDQEALEFIKKRTGKILDLKICTQADLNHVLDQYSGISTELKKIVDSVEEDEQSDTKPQGEIEAKAKEKEVLETAPAAKVVQSLVERAVREGASDIHIEPTEEEVIVRFRVDGILRKVISLPIEILPAVVSRVKILSGMKIDETRLPQDGRFQINFNQSSVDFRVSTFPTVNGEKIVARILDKSAGILTLEQLGIRGSAFAKINDNIHKAHGMILVTGPTGSGKTTTLYAMIQKMMSVTNNIVTLEDPVEYRIPTINQAQVRSDIGFDFASGLRSILRQDPDIIMIGEIRDYETADMAVHSALTGHIVLSTLHTNDAAGAVPRLIDMKIEPFLINSSLNVVVAQRLCRKICETCREPLELDAVIMAEVAKEIQDLPAGEAKPVKIEFFHGKGCGNCGNSGYRGRVGIYEVFEMVPDIRSMVAKEASSGDLATAAHKNGMVTLKQDGILKAISGITTLEEIWRVTKE